MMYQVENLNLSNGRRRKATELPQNFSLQDGAVFHGERYRGWVLLLWGRVGIAIYPPGSEGRATRYAQGLAVKFNDLIPRGCQSRGRTIPWSLRRSKGRRRTRTTLVGR